MSDAQRALFTDDVLEYIGRTVWKRFKRIANLRMKRIIPVDDYIQDAMLLSCEVTRTFNSPDKSENERCASFKTYIFTAIHRYFNKPRHWYQYQSTQHAEDWLEDDNVEYRESPEHIFVLRMLDMLSASEREVIKFRFGIMGSPLLSPMQIARQRGLQRKLVNETLDRAMERIRHFAEHYDFGEHLGRRKKFEKIDEKFMDFESQLIISWAIGQGVDIVSAIERQHSAFK